MDQWEVPHDIFPDDCSELLQLLLVSLVVLGVGILPHHLPVQPLRPHHGQSSRTGDLAKDLK